MKNNHNVLTMSRHHGRLKSLTRSSAVLELVIVFYDFKQDARREMACFVTADAREKLINKNTHNICTLFAYIGKNKQTSILQLKPTGPQRMCVKFQCDFHLDRRANVPRGSVRALFIASVLVFACTNTYPYDPRHHRFSTLS